MYTTAVLTEAIIPKAGEDNLDFAVTRRWGIWTGRCFRLSLGLCRERGGPRHKLASALPPACKHTNSAILVATVTTFLLTMSINYAAGCAPTLNGWHATSKNTQDIPSLCWNSLSVTAGNWKEHAFMTVNEMIIYYCRTVFCVNSIF